MKNTISITLIDDDENESQHQLPAKNEVCDRCQGYGTHTNPSIDGDGITQSEMTEILHEDPDFLDNYMGGLYDITCEVCHGNKVILVPDSEACDKDQLEILKQYNDQIEEHYRSESVYRAEVEAERRMGC